MRAARVLVLAVALAGGVLVQAPAAAASESLVLALYYPWYGLDVWDDPVLSDRPAIPYHGSDPEVIRRHVAWAKNAGIDVLVTAWYGPAGNNMTEGNVRALLDVAAQAGIRVAVMIETDALEFFPSRETQVAAIEHAVTVHAAHPAYLRQDGKPVVVFWRPRGLWVGDQRAGSDDQRSAQAWRAFRDEMDPDREALWIAEGEYMPYLDAFDGIMPYNIAWANNPSVQLATYGRSVRDYSARNGVPKLWVATAMPGYDDTGLEDRRDRFAVDRANGAYYRQTFAGALASNPDWINISSFNEWVEGHQIEPSVTYGELYLDLTRELVATWNRPSSR